MKTTPKFMWVNLMVISVVLSMSSKSWLTLWALLEINTISFIMTIFLKTQKEKTLIFLLFQSVSSLTLMVFIFQSYWSMEQSNLKNMSYMLLTAMFLKIGMFPLHNWLLKTMEGFSWEHLMVLMTWQKLMPTLLIIKMKSLKNSTLIFIACMAALSTLLIKMSKAKVMISTSSLMHNTWMFLPMNIMKLISLSYIVVYSTMLIPICMMMKKFMNTFLLMKPLSKSNTVETTNLMLSFAGIPPSIGFFLKMAILMVIVKMCIGKMPMMVVFMSSCMAFFIYFQVFLKNFKCMKTPTKELVKNNNSKPLKIPAMLLLVSPLITM